MVGIKLRTDDLVIQIGLNAFGKGRYAMGHQIFAEGAAPARVRQKNVFIQRFRQPQDIVKAIHAVGVQHALKFQAGIPIHGLERPPKGFKFFSVIWIPYIHIFEITAKIVYVAADLRNLNSIYPRILVKHLQQCFTVLSRREGKP